MVTEFEFSQEVAHKLEDAGFSVESKPSIEGVRPDLLVGLDDGRRFVIELKSWQDPDRRDIAIATRQAQLFKKTTNSDKAFVVIKGLKHSHPYAGLLAAKDLVLALTKARQEIPSKKTVIQALQNVEIVDEAESAKSSLPKKTVFAAMPYSVRYEDTYFLGIIPAATSVNAASDRADYDNYVGDAVQNIKKRILGSDVVVADLSESRPNVLYELGFAEASSVKTVQICSTPPGQLPFDVRNNSTLSYSLGRIHKLSTDLSERLKGVLS